MKGDEHICYWYYYINAHLKLLIKDKKEAVSKSKTRQLPVDII